MFLIIMGIIVTSELELTNGITINDFYININHIEIVKSRIENIKYNIRAQRQIYLNKSKRDIIIESHPIIICTENLTDRIPVSKVCRPNRLSLPKLKNKLSI